jgi:hypothetical protein
MTSTGLQVRPPTSASLYSYVGGAAQSLTASPNRPLATGIHRCAPGPWGDIEYHFIYLEASEQLIAKYRLPGTTSRWTFPGATREQLAALFAAAKLPSEWISGWLDEPQLLEQDGELHVFPSPGQLEAISRESRGVIYRELAKCEANSFHRDPVFITSGSVEDFFRGTGIAMDHVVWFERMCYLRGDVLCFADVPALLARGRNSEEALRLFRSCSRTRAIMARLRPSGQSDLAALLDYWGGGHRRRDLLPMFQSAVETGAPLDILHLLPPLARKLVNSYPPLELAINGRMPDCHWSSLNFFNYEPRGYYLDSRLASSHVLQNFDRCEPPYRFGDTIFFMSATGEAFHSCVFIADDLVFTKNGDNPANAWIMTRMGDIKQVYLSASGGHLQGFRMRAPLSA